MARGAGALDERITFQRLTRTADNMGGAVETWANLATTPTVWARVRPMRATERTDQDRVNAEGIWEFVIRTRSDLSEADRLVWRGENYNIRAIMREGPRPLYLRITAERGAG